nr:uncharacterized protein LOC111988743 [Quercus suber]
MVERFFLASQIEQPNSHKKSDSDPDPIMLLSGPPSCGKSSLLFQFAFNSAIDGNRNVVFICNRRKLESSSSFLSQVWTKLWNLNVPKKVKVFGWRACQNILPTRANLRRRRVIDDDACTLCLREAETGVHALWDCAVARDVWAGSLTRLQKWSSGQHDVLQLFHELLIRLTTDEFELFLVQAWLIWNQRNTVVHRGKMRDPRWLNKRAREYLSEFQQSQDQLNILLPRLNANIWVAPTDPVYKLNFDAAIFKELNCSGIGAIIRNGKGEVMAAMSAKGPLVEDSEEAETLACRKAVEFAIDAGFSELVIEGDNAAVMASLSHGGPDLSRLGHVVQDVQWLATGLRWVSFSHVKRCANTVAHGLARHAKNVMEDMIWLEETPPPVVEALSNDLLYLSE